MATKYTKQLMQFSNKKVPIYAGSKVTHALNLIGEMSIYEGVKMLQLLEAVYEQGKKDGARSVFEAIEGKVKEVEKAIPYRNPGQPKKKPK